MDGQAVSVVAAVRRDLARLPEDLASGALAASALALASEMDDRNSATSKSMCAKALLDTLNRLRELAPPERVANDLTRQRALREARLAGRGSAS
jgi:hypothetical protein